MHGIIYINYWAKRAVDDFISTGPDSAFLSHLGAMENKDDLSRVGMKLLLKGRKEKILEEQVTPKR